MAVKRVLVINPNSNESVTDGLRRTLEGRNDVVIDCCTLHDGPFGIETDRDIEMVAPLVLSKIQSAEDYDAYVIACYSDPGLKMSRHVVAKPIFGMQESAVREAVSMGGKFGVLALSDDSIRRHVRYIRELGFEDKLAAELPLNISVDQAANARDTVDKVVSVGRQLVDDYGASAVILGCAGMAAIKKAAETKLPVPVIEPAQAAVRIAIEVV